MSKRLHASGVHNDKIEEKSIKHTHMNSVLHGGMQNAYF